MRRAARLIGFLAIVAAAPPATAADRLTPLLRFVPTEAVASGLRAPVAFTDLAALRAAGVESVPEGERAGWSPADLELAGLARVGAMPSMLQDYLQYWEQHELATTREYLGFAWSDIELAIGFGAPPDHVVVVAGAPAVTDAADIGAVLTGRGFVAEDRGGYPFWWRLEDNRLDLRSRDPADPLRGHLGGSGRAGIVDGAFVASANWSSIDRLLAVHDSGRTLADSVDFVALAHALDQPITGDGALLQAYLMAGAFELDAIVASLTGNLSEEAIAELRARLSGEGGAPGTPRYSAIAIADRQEGGQAVGVAALVYASREDAELAIRTVPEAVATQESLATRQPFSELLPFEIVTAVVATPDGARHVAVVGFATTLPSRTRPAEMVPTPFGRLVQMMFRGDVGPLVAGD